MHTILRILSSAACSSALIFCGLLFFAKPSAADSEVATCQNELILEPGENFESASRLTAAEHMSRISSAGTDAKKLAQAIIRVSLLPKKDFSPELLEKFASISKSADADVKCAMLSVMFTLKDPAAIRIASGMLEDSDERVRQAAIKNFGTLREPLPGAVSKRILSSAEQAASTGAFYYACGGGLNSLARSCSEEVCNPVVKLLVKILDSTPIPNAKSGKSRHEQEAPISCASIALGDLGRTAEGAVPRLAALLSSPEISPGTKSNVVIALGKIRSAPSVSVPAMVGAFEGDDSSLRSFAKTALKEFGPEGEAALAASLSRQSGMPRTPPPEGERKSGGILSVLEEKVQKKFSEIEKTLDGDAPREERKKMPELALLREAGTTKSVVLAPADLIPGKVGRDAIQDGVKAFPFSRDGIVIGVRLHRFPSPSIWSALELEPADMIQFIDEAHIETTDGLYSQLAEAFGRQRPFSLLVQRRGERFFLNVSPKTGTPGNG